MRKKEKRAQKRGKPGRWAQEKHSESFSGVKRGKKMERTDGGGGEVWDGGGFVGHVSPGCRGASGGEGWGPLSGGGKEEETDEARK